MCEEWKSDFSAFLRDMKECPPGLTLDRIEGDGHYEPGNCRWATAKEQARNRRGNKLIPHEGSHVALAEFAEIMGVSYKQLQGRLRRGATLIQAVASLKGLPQPSPGRLK